jgi:hypothetical protein
MRQDRTRSPRHVDGGGPPSTAGRRLVVVLGIVAIVMVGLVVYREWLA